MSVALSLFLIGFGQAFAQDNDEDERDLAVLETGLGTIVIEFFPKDAPNHVNNFIGLAESGFYDGTIFHRIIPGFMIQGGDPNTINGDSSTWGQGGPDENMDAEFNTIKHNRGIVSMARSADPNSAGSQFFIIHQDSTFLDGLYTVFGRIVTEQSFQTLDKIAAVPTEDQSMPIDITDVKIIKATIVAYSKVPNLLDLSEPERMQLHMSTLTGSQKFESSKHNVAFDIPEGWLLQQPDKTNENSPDIVLVGPSVDGTLNPKISFTAKQTNQIAFDDIVSERIKELNVIAQIANLNIISNGKTIINGNQAYAIEMTVSSPINGKQTDIKFKEVIFYYPEKFYTFVYHNGLDNFGLQLPMFEEITDSFKILSDDETVITTQAETSGTDDSAEDVQPSDAEMTPAETSGTDDSAEDVQPSDAKMTPAETSGTDDSAEDVQPSDAKMTPAETSGTDDSAEDVQPSDAKMTPAETSGTDDSAEDEGEGGCLIATATFGSEMASQVQHLRELRDNTILSTESGTSFMAGFNQIYYSFSPTIADMERENPIFKEAVKLAITPVLSTLSILNHAEINSEEEMISYGIGVILMNVGIYFAAPAIFIYKIKRISSNRQ